MHNPSVLYAVTKRFRIAPLANILPAAQNNGVVLTMRSSDWGIPPKAFLVFADGE
jgi:hypothetical protein